MLTKSDLQKIKQLLTNFATKDDFEKLRADFEKLRIDVREDIVQFKDDILKQIIDLRDETTMVVGYRDMIEDHDQRITKLETKILKHN